jgi:hydrogenase maturation protease
LTDYLIVGVGNTLRGDDGAGVVLAERLYAALTQRGVSAQLRLAPQLLPELAAEVAEIAPAVLVIADCAVGGGSAGLQLLAPVQMDTSGSHGMAAEQLLALAVRLYEFCGRAWLATVPGINFAHGEGLTPAAQQAIDDSLPLMVAQLLAVSPSVDL